MIKLFNINKIIKKESNKDEIIYFSNISEYYNNVPAVKPIKQICPACKKEKITRHMTEREGRVCDSCLLFMSGMDNQAKWGRFSPIKVEFGVILNGIVYLEKKGE